MIGTPRSLLLGLLLAAARAHLCAASAAANTIKQPRPDIASTSHERQRVLTASPAHEIHAARQLLQLSNTTQLSSDGNSSRTKPGYFSSNGHVATPLSTSITSGRDGLPDVAKRPLRLLPDLRTALDLNGARVQYVQHELLPALQSLLARSVRVRAPLLSV